MSEELSRERSSLKLERIKSTLRQVLKNGNHTGQLLDFLDGNDLLSVEGMEDGEKEVLALVEVLLSLLVDVVSLKVKREVRAGFVLLVHESDETFLINVNELVILAGDNRGRHVVRRRGDILILPTSEDVDTNNIGLGVTVLAGLGGGILNNLAREALDDDMGTLLQSTWARRRGGQMRCTAEGRFRC